MDASKNKMIWSVLVLIVIFGAGFYFLNRNLGTSSLPQAEDEKAGVEASPGETVSYLKAPAGFKLAFFAKNVPGARAIELDSKGNILVSQTREGTITALHDANGDGTAEEKSMIATGLTKPHGMAMNCEEGGSCFLYVAEAHQLSRFPYDAETPSLGKQEKLMDIAYSGGDNHFTRSLLFLPSPNQDTLLISAGSSCNVCDEKDTDHASIMSYNIKTKKKEQYARGLRNAVFMTLHPVSGKVYATEMGRDNLGDNLPPDEINIIEKDNKGQSKNYGWPICYGKNIHDTQFDPEGQQVAYGAGKKTCSFYEPSFVDLQAHSAPLGLNFIPEEGWDEDMWYDLLVAYHGSWNRSVPTGYKIVRLRMNAQGQYEGIEDFITGFLGSDGEKLGRPVDIKVFPGGTAYITDDEAGAVYKLSRTTEAQ